MISRLTNLQVQATAHSAMHLPHRNPFAPQKPGQEVNEHRVFMLLFSNSVQRTGQGVTLLPSGPPFNVLSEGREHKSNHCSLLTTAEWGVGETDVIILHWCQAYICLHRCGKITELKRVSNPGPPASQLCALPAELPISSKWQGWCSQSLVVVESSTSLESLSCAGDISPAQKIEPNWTSRTNWQPSVQNFAILLLY